MSKVLVLHYPSDGHVEAMAPAVAEGIRSAGASYLGRHVAGIAAKLFR